MDKVERLYNQKIIKSGERLEVYKYQSYQREGGKSKNNKGRRGKVEVSCEQKEMNSIQSKKQNLYKARNNIIRLISANNDLDIFITLTFAQEPTIPESKKQLDNFFKRLKRVYKDLKYLYVLEFGSRKGRLHYHCLMNIEINKEIFYSKKKFKSINHKAYEREFSKKYWKNGFVDIRNLGVEGNTNIALYVATYLVEDLFNLNIEGSKCYGFSRNLNRPTVKKIISKNKNYVISQEDYKLKFINSYDIRYLDKRGQERKSKVVYSDYYKNKK